MDGFQLDMDEVMLVSDTNVYSKKLKGNNWKAFLTNKRLVCYRLGMFNKPKDCFEYEINSIKKFNNKPAIILDDGYGHTVFSFITGQLELGFFDRKAKKQIIASIHEIVTGEELNQSVKSISSGAAVIADTLGESLAAFKKGLGIKTKNDEIITKYCSDCGAKVSGKRGTTVECQYCGSMITIK